MAQEKQTFAEAFLAVQAEIRPAIKDAQNPHFKSSYADLGSVWDAVREPLQRNKFAIIQTTDFDAQDMWLETKLLHVSGESVRGRYPLRPTKADPQGYGSALTYARRYSVMALLGVIADDDDGNAANARPKETTPASASRQPQHAEQAPKGSGDDAAKKWGEDAISYVNRTGDSAKFKAWHDKNLNTIARLGEIHPDIHKRLIVAINNRHDAFASARAA